MKSVWRQVGEAAALTAALLMVSCGDDDSPADPNQPGGVEPGPLDGSWTLDRIECNGSQVDAGGASVHFEFASSGAVATVTGGDGCAVTLRSNVTYPASDRLVTTDESVSCSPVNCSDSCDEPVDDTPENVRFTRTGDSLRLESQAEDDEGFCRSSETQALVLRKS